MKINVGVGAICEYQYSDIVIFIIEMFGYIFEKF